MTIEIAKKNQGPSRFLERDLNLYFPSKENGAPGTIRTSDPQIRSLMLYPAELRALGEAAHKGQVQAWQSLRRDLFELDTGKQIDIQWRHRKTGNFRGFHP